MSRFFETIVDAKTGVQTTRQFSTQEIAAIRANARDEKLASLAAVRWLRETGGMIFNGHVVATDTTSQTKIIGAVVGAQLDPTASIKWKMADGEFVTLDATAIVALGVAMRGHVQACFDNEARLRALIEAAADADAIDAIDIMSGWPA
jgi:predicted pyridoxine 5'-phosphate oxidase superfamily flavin-nucleotide-binding protein